MNEAAAETTVGEPVRARKPALTLIEVLVAVIVVGVLAAVFVPQIIRRRREAREAAVERAFTAISLDTAAPVRVKEVKELLAAFPELVNARNQEGRTLLYGATFLGRKDVVELLLAYGADVNARKTGEDWTPLLYAVFLEQGAIVELLLANGADVNARFASGSTALHFAAARGRQDLTNSLLAKGADVNAKDNEGQTPLAVAEEEGHTELVELLKKHGAKESE